MVGFTEVSFDCCCFDLFTHVHYYSMGLAFFVSFIGQTAIYPLDIVRRRMQVDTKHDKLVFRKAFVKIVRENGFLSLYKGITLSWIKLPVVIGISFGTFDSLYYFLNKHVHYS